MSIEAKVAASSVLGKRKTDEKLNAPTKDDRKHNQPATSHSPSTIVASTAANRTETPKERIWRRITMMHGKFPLNDAVLHGLDLIRDGFYVLGTELYKIAIKRDDAMPAHRSKSAAQNDLQEFEALFKRFRESLENIYAKVKIVDKELSQEVFEDLAGVQSDFETIVKRTFTLDVKYFEGIIGQLQAVNVKACDALILPCGLSITTSQPTFIYRILTVEQFAEFQKTRVFVGGEKDIKDGFIHASREDQYMKVYYKIFAGQVVVVLKIDPKQIGESKIKTEADKTGETFPHIYGTIPIGAVVEYSTICKERQ